MIKTGATRQQRLRTAERLRHTWALKAPQVFPLVGDGPEATRLMRPYRRDGGPDSYLAYRKGGWRQVMLRTNHIELMAARYRDWLAQRDRHRQAAA